MNYKAKLLLLSTVCSAASFALAVDHQQNYTPEFLANQAQTGNINKASVYYNPAALTKLDNGFYVQLGMQ